MKEQFIKNAQAALLRDTIKFYNVSNRCHGGGGCQYRPTEDSPGCAIGRHVANKELCAQWDIGFDGSPGIGNWDDTEIINLGAPLAVLGREFLAGIQTLHDSITLWDSAGLSLFGREKAELLCKNFGLDENQVFQPAK